MKVSTEKIENQQVVLTIEVVPASSDSIAAAYLSFLLSVLTLREFAMSFVPSAFGK